MSTSPPNTFSFIIDMTGDETGNSYQGRFVYIRPTVGMRRDIDQIEFILNSEYKQKYKVEELAKSVKNYNYTIAYLKICLKECPEWFEKSDYGLTLEDENVLDAIAFKIKTFEDKRIKEIEKIIALPRQKIEEDKETNG